MADGEVIYSVRTAHPQYVDRGRPQRVRLAVYAGGDLATPEGGTYSLLDSGGTVLATGDVDVVDRIAGFDLPALSDTQTLGYGYFEDWDLEMPDGTSRSFRRDAVVVPRSLYPVVTDEDIYSAYSDLRRQRPTTANSWEEKRLEAWKRILGRLEGQENMPNLIGTPWSLREAHLELSLHLILQDLRTGQAGKWESLAQDHKREFEFAWKRLKYRELDDDGAALASEDQVPAEGVVVATVPPADSWGF